jgi:CheY-like chemotaxis protein
MTDTGTQQRSSRLAGSKLVLVVERDPPTRELVTHFLRGIGLTVELVSDGVAALEATQRLQPDLIVTEVLVPKLDGLALCRRIKGSPETRGTAVLITSILASSARAREAGADAFLLKPLSEDRLVGAVKSILREDAQPRKQEGT